MRPMMTPAFRTDRRKPDERVRDTTHAIPPRHIQGRIGSDQIEDEERERAAGN